MGGMLVEVVVGEVEVAETVRVGGSGRGIGNKKASDSRGGGSSTMESERWGCLRMVVEDVV